MSMALSERMPTLRPISSRRLRILSIRPRICFAGFDGFPTLLVDSLGARLDALRMPLLYDERRTTIDQTQPVSEIPAHPPAHHFLKITTTAPIIIAKPTR